MSHGTFPITFPLQFRGDPEAGRTHNVVLGTLGLYADMPNLVKSDITVALPRVVTSAVSRKHQDFSDLDAHGQESFHHGKGDLDFNDPEAFFQSSGVDTRIRGMTMLAPLQSQTYKTGGADGDFNGAPADFTLYAGNWYLLIKGTAATDNAIYVWDNTNSEWDLLTSGLDTSSGTPGNLEQYNNDLFVAQGEADNYRWFDGATWANGNVPARYFKEWDGHLWRADNLNELYYSDNPDAGAPTWSGAYVIGDTTALITGLSVFQGRLIVRKQDGLYALFYNTEIASPDYQVVTLLDLKALRDDDNGKGAANWQGFLYFNTSGGGVSRFDGSTEEPLSPNRGTHDPSRDPREVTFQGTTTKQEFVSMIGTNNWLYAAAKNNTSSDRSEILAYGGLGWHPLIDPGADNISIDKAAFIPALSSSGVMANPTLWFNRGENVYYAILPEGTENPADYSGSRYAASGSVTTAWFDATLADLPKTFFNMVVISENCVIGAQEILVEYEVDRQGTWYTLGTVAHSPSQVLVFPDGSLRRYATIAKAIRFRFTLSTTGNTTTPILRTYFVRFITRPPVRYGWNIPIFYEDRARGVDRETETLTKETLQRAVWAFRSRKDAIFFDDGELSPPSLTNALRNPSFETDTDGDGLADRWSKIDGGETTSLNGQYKVGLGRSQRVVTDATSTMGIVSTDTISIDNGEDGYVSAHVHVASGDAVTIELQNAASGATLASTTVPEHGETSLDPFIRAAVAVANSTGAPVSARLRIYRAAAAASRGTVFYVDRSELISGTDTNPSYIDGEEERCWWGGAPHASESVRQLGYSVYIAGMNDSPRAPRIKRDASGDEVQEFAGVLNLHLREMA